MEAKNSFENILQAQLDAWTAIVGRLRANAEKAHADLRRSLMAEVEVLAAYQRKAQTYIQKFHQAKDDVWTGMKPDIDFVRAEMGQAMDRA